MRTGRIPEVEPLPAVGRVVHPIDQHALGPQCTHDKWDWDARRAREKTRIESRGWRPGRCLQQASMLVDGEAVCRTHAKEIVFTRVLHGYPETEEE